LNVPSPKKELFTRDYWWDGKAKTTYVSEKSLPYNILV
jgi:hypothetical protein